MLRPVRIAWTLVASGRSMLRPYSSYALFAQNLSQSVKLGDVGHGGEEHKLVAAPFFVAANELGDGLRGREQAGGYLLGEGAGESVVVAHVAHARLNGGVVPQREVALSPYLRLARTPGVEPGGAGFVGGARDGPGRP